MSRYRVGSVTGTKIRYATSSQSHGKIATLWYVHDTVDAYRIVNEFIGNNAEGRASELCNRLNAEEDAWLRERGIE
jgi:hypothetical protein